MKSFYPGDIPQKPGVYIYRNQFGNVIYVGKATNLRKRVSSYFQKSRQNNNDPKFRSLVNSISSWEIITVKNEDEALILESKLIKEYSPKYNILLRDDKRYLLIKINLNDTFPKLSLTRIRKNDNAKYFGPFPKGSILKETIDFLTRYFKLRSCKVLKPTEKDHKHCLASRIKDCSAPCIDKVSDTEYKNQVDDMLKILSGDIKPILSDLERKMLDAAKNKNFENAAKWRDSITNIKAIFGEKNRTFRNTHIPSESGMDAVLELQKVLKLDKPPTHIECFDNSNTAGTLPVSSMVCFKNGKPSKKDYRRFKIKTVNKPDDFATMVEVIKRHYSRKLRENAQVADLLIVDGGKGQLSSAICALKEINFPTINVIGIAKKQEEIFLPNKKESIIIDRHSSAIRLIQSLRDEAHRFAITFHKSLRDKRIEESILDDIPGIGKTRKLAILKVYKSMKKLKQDTPEEISKKIPQIGIKLAKIILDNC